MNRNARGIMLALNVSAAGGTGGLTLRMHARDSVSGLCANLNAAPTAVTATDVPVATIAPSNGIGAPGIHGALPGTFCVPVVHGAASVATERVG